MRRAVRRASLRAARPPFWTTGRAMGSKPPRENPPYRQCSTRPPAYLDRTMDHLDEVTDQISQAAQDARDLAAKIGPVKNYDYSAEERIRGTHRDTPQTIRPADVDSKKAVKAARMKVGNILKNVPDERLVKFSGRSALALEELKRRIVLDHMQDEAGAALGDIAAVGYEDIDVFGLLDTDKSGCLDIKELQALAELLEIGTGLQLHNAIKEESADGNVTPLEFSNWWYRHVGYM